MTKVRHPFFIHKWGPDLPQTAHIRFTRILSNHSKLRQLGRKPRGNFWVASGIGNLPPHFKNSFPLPPPKQATAPKRKARLAKAARHQAKREKSDSGPTLEGEEPTQQQQVNTALDIAVTASALLHDAADLAESDDSGAAFWAIEDTRCKRPMGNYDRDSFQWRVMQQQNSNHQQQPPRAYYPPQDHHPASSNNSTAATYFLNEPNMEQRRPQTNTGAAGYGGNSSAAYYGPPAGSKRPRHSYERSSPVDNPTRYTDYHGLSAVPVKEMQESPTMSSARNQQPQHSHHSTMGSSAAATSTVSSSSSYLPTLDAGGLSLSYPSYSSVQSPRMFEGETNSLPAYHSEWFLNRVSLNTPVGSSASNPNSHATVSNQQSHNQQQQQRSIDDSRSSLASRISGTSLLSPPAPHGNNNNMFGSNEPPLMNDYETGFYSLWHGSNGANVMGYEPDTDHHHASSVGQDHPVTGPLYMPDEEELKMEYAPLSEAFNQDELLEDLYGPIEAETTAAVDASSASLGGPNHGLSIMVPDRRDREPHMERLIGPGGELMKRDRYADEVRASSYMNTSKGGVITALGSPYGTMSESTGGFRALARNAEIKRPAAGQKASSSYRNTAASSTSAAAGRLSYGGSPLGVSTGRDSIASVGHDSASVTPGSDSSRSGATTGDFTTAAKRPRSRQCDFPGCLNRARSHQKCKKHGGAHQCVFEGCTKNSQSRGLCIAHGGGSRCKVEGCVRAAQSKGLCKSHGGGEFCAVEDCRKKAHLKHLCRTHGGGVRCKNPKCSKWAQRKGWCMAHAKEFLGP